MLFTPYKTEHIHVPGSPHYLYIEHYGQKKKPLVICVHGGPGGKSLPQKMLRLLNLNLSQYHIVFFDQRGCGKSVPRNCMLDNTPLHAVEDIERIRKHCGAHKLVICGGSYGTAIALWYAVRYSQHITGIVLRGVYLFGDVLACSLRKCYPIQWESLQEHVHQNSFQKVCAHTFQKLVCENDTALVRKWCNMENQEFPSSMHGSAMDQYTQALFESGFQTHRFFLPENFSLLHACKTLNKIPTIIIHGARDMICPVRQAVAISKAMGSHTILHIVPDSGHNAFEPRMRAAFHKHVPLFVHTCVSRSFRNNHMSDVKYEANSVPFKVKKVLIRKKCTIHTQRKSKIINTTLKKKNHS